MSARFVQPFQKRRHLIALLVKRGEPPRVPGAARPVGENAEQPRQFVGAGVVFRPRQLGQ
jgi:hypothetical protein